LSLSYEPYKQPVGKRKEPPKVSSQEAIKLRKKKKEEFSDPPYAARKEVCNMRRKKIKPFRQKLIKRDGRRGWCGWSSG
jgi:hypothetical protein